MPPSCKVTLPCVKPLRQDTMARRLRGQYSRFVNERSSRRARELWLASLMVRYGVEDAERTRVLARLRNKPELSRSESSTLAWLLIASEGAREINEVTSGMGRVTLVGAASEIDSEEGAYERLGEYTAHAAFMAPVRALDK